ncbi:MAG: GTPase HflX [Acidobacteriota bacterium]
MLPFAPASNHRSRKVFLVGVVFPTQPRHVVEEHLDELAELVRTLGAEVAGRAVQQRPAPDPATYIGRGKAESIGAEARATGAETVVFDDDLSGGQEKNLEQIFKLAVADRSALILDIFDRRARSREARTQVELARLNYLLPRLAKRWSHLERQVGGIGVRGGAGETQLEADRRMLKLRIQRLERDLEKITRTRAVQRRGRSTAVTVALAGYTNAGKSTLFNALTSADALAEDRLFATLDAKLRRGKLAAGRSVVFADTVGFIRKLPHHLVASFKSTLEEVTRADLILHVVDRSHPQWEEQRAVAEEVLRELGVEPERTLLVYNKSDLVERELCSGEGIWISARTGEGLERLRAAIGERLEDLGRLPRLAAAAS